MLKNESCHQDSDTVTNGKAFEHVARSWNNLQIIIEEIPMGFGAVYVRIRGKMANGAVKVSTV